MRKKSSRVSLVGMLELLRVCRKRTDGRSEGVDRKLDLLVHELQRYGVSKAGVQESKWFGVDVWTAADGYTFLHSGRPLPGSADVATRNEGVGILLDARASEARWGDMGGS